MRAKPFVTAMMFTALATVSCAKKENKESDLSSLSKVASSDAELPACTNDLISQVFWVEDGKKFVICNGSKYVEVKGEKGETGEKGDSGSEGDVGPAGSPANSGVWIFDAAGKAIGVIVDVDRGLVLLSNGGLTRVNLGSGAYAYGVALNAAGGLVQSPAVQVECYFTESTCGGSCYQLKFGGVEKTVGGTIYYAGSSYYQATGAEVLVDDAVVKSAIDVNTGSCYDFGDVVVDAYPITKLYSLPAGVSFPLQTPLSFGFKTED